MVFSTPIFLFGFLPLIILIYYLSPKFLKNTVLLTGSLFFYAWGEAFYVAIMIVSIISNYTFGRLIERERSEVESSHEMEVKSKKKKGKDTSNRRWLAAGIFVNLLILCSFKYSTFIAYNINVGLIFLGFSTVSFAPVHLPLGISFFTFQALSYLVDVYRGETTAQKNILNLAMYISLFPQLIAGPIVRYHDIASQLTKRRHSLAIVASGMQRFIFGLAKKMLIANPLGEIADTVFVIPLNDLPWSVAWLGILCYSLQILFDFSGYSDMAIGLGRMFGFRFIENFNYPYISRSIKEFWRRWHISLSTWFRDYLYIPLGGSRVSQKRVYFNLIVVFLLCGLWHGASWNFVLWGGIHGFFLVLERAGLSKILTRLWMPFRHFYTLSVVVIAWVFFRIEDIGHAFDFLQVMFNLWPVTSGLYSIPLLVDHEAFVAFFFAVILVMPVSKFIYKLGAGLSRVPEGDFLPLQLFLPKIVFISSLFFLSILKVASSTYNPFIYFRF